jgi:hypothetical protein
VLDVESPTSATYQARCERGVLELKVMVSPATGGVLGFSGTSRGVAAPAPLARAAEGVASLVGRWDDRVYKRHLAKLGLGPAELKAFFAGQRAARGACTVRDAVHEGFTWAFGVACERGGNLTLRVASRASEPAQLRQMQLLPVEGRCPRR